MKDNWLIPNRILIPIVNDAIRTRGKCGDNWYQSELEVIREKCGPEYAHVVLDHLRNRIVNLRKANLLQKVRGHGPSRLSEVPEDLKKHYESERWITFSDGIKKFWEGCCAICKSAKSLNVHHNTYERLGDERISDVICLCRVCHKLFHKRMQKYKTNGVENGKTNGHDNDLVAGTRIIL